MKKNISILAGVIFLHLLFLTKLKFTAWPEMLLWPYLTIHGLLPYKDIAIAHTPHLIVDLAVIYKIFGVGITQLKIYTWLVIIITDIVLYLVSKKLWNQKIAVTSLIIFVIWQVFFDGNGLWFDLVLAPIALITFYLAENKKYFWVGMFWVFMFFTKQTAAFFLIPILFYIRKFKDFFIGLVLAVIIWTIVLLAWGNLPGFYHWAISYGIFILPRAQGQIQLPDIKTMVVALFPFLIFLPFLLRTKFRNINLFVWSIAGMLGAYPRFEYLHFQPAVPFLAIASAIVLIEHNKGELLKWFMLIYLLGSFYLLSNYFIRNWGEGTRFYEQDVVDVSSYVKNHTNPGEKIFVLNWWDNIYALTGTIPATDPWIPQLSWYQNIKGVQENEVADLSKSKPKMIVFQDYDDSGLGSYKPQVVYDYIIKNYQFKEKVDGIEILVPNK